MAPLFFFNMERKILSLDGTSKFEKPVSLDPLKNISMVNLMVFTSIGGKMERKRRKKTSTMECPMGFGKAGTQMAGNNWNNPWRMENYTARREGGIKMVREKMTLYIRMAELFRSWSGNRMGRSVQIPNYSTGMGYGSAITRMGLNLGDRITEMANTY